jgi:hypothetical protein
MRLKFKSRLGFRPIPLRAVGRDNCPHGTGTRESCAAETLDGLPSARHNPRLYEACALRTRFPGLKN